MVYARNNSFYDPSSFFNLGSLNFLQQLEFHALIYGSGFLIKPVCMISRAYVSRL